MARWVGLEAVEPLVPPLHEGRGTPEMLSHDPVSLTFKSVLSHWTSSWFWSSGVGCETAT